MKISYYYLGFICLFIFTGCTPKTVEPRAIKIVSTTVKPKGKAPVLKYFHKTDKSIVGKSAYHPLHLPVDALAARLFIIDHAKTSVDVQYYIYDDDTVGKVFSEHLLLAAQRGVRVRMLLDDLSTSGKDQEIQKLALHPNVELRLFNPNRLRNSFRNLALLFNVNSLGKRMHNKSLIVDGSVAIIGGRNIGDVYFAATDETLFLDYDIISIGKVVPEISKSFDIYWNSEQSIPSSNVLEKSHYEVVDNSMYDGIKNELNTFMTTAFGMALQHSEFKQKINTNKLLFTVADKTNFYYDDPSKVARHRDDNALHITQQVSEDLKHVDTHLTIISPYFIPSDSMMKRMSELREKGAKITIVTNSLASTDVSPVYAGYQGYIKELLAMGVNLYELKPYSLHTLAKAKGKFWKKIPTLSLHTKMMLLDNDRLVVGSANIDPRSEKLNTELLMMITSKTLTKSQQKVIDTVINLKYMYKLSWEKHPITYESDVPKYGPVWRTLEEGRVKKYYERPEVGFWKKFGTDILSLLPIKGYL